MNPLLPVLILVTTCCVPAVASAQSAPPHLSPAPSHLLWQRPASVLTAEWAREPLGGILGPGNLDHRYAGFFVGAALGLAGTAFSFVWCGDEDNACDQGRVLPIGLVLTAAGGLSGAVMGGFLPKASPPRDSTPE
jgi:hypothetical protein